MLILLLLQAASPAPLNLTCLGGGTANKVVSTTAYGSSQSYGSVGTTPITMSGSGSATVSSIRHVGFADQVDLRLFAKDDRIRLPRTLLPPIHGGNDGWFRLKNLKADARSIEASIAVNFMNNPKVHIDRTTGTISISGKAGNYTGQCEAVAVDAPAKF